MSKPIMGNKCCKCSAAKDEVKKGEGPDPADYEKLYFKAEFTAMDRENRGKLTTAEFVKLMMFLGYGEKWKVDSLLKSINTEGDGYITIDEFYNAMNRPEVKAGTSRLRNIFFKFDDNKDGRATREQILQGFADMGVEVDDEITAKVTELDTNNDGRVKYQDFVQSQLVTKGILK
ncbi:calmodulin-4-like isoform X1 [Ostrea edulis]|uniref:calmodulin-4-like isoform X1 n=1 Tax=Ostrea edulis TaxID=37623 RepID=UPI0020963FBF|nr:calmodulin-4-like isoform X1 [Ostrea edulis]